MRFPSVATIEKNLHVDRATAKRIRGFMDGTLDPEQYSRAAQDCALRAYNRHDRYYLALVAIDEALETCGVEGFTVKEKSGRRGPPVGTHVSYCNAGDTYACTVAYTRVPTGYGSRGQWHVTHYGYFLGD